MIARRRLQADLRSAKAQSARLDETADKGGDQRWSAAQARASAASYQRHADRILSTLLNASEGDLS